MLQKLLLSKSQFEIFSYSPTLPMFNFLGDEYRENYLFSRFNCFLVKMVWKENSKNALKPFNTAIMIWYYADI